RPAARRHSGNRRHHRLRRCRRPSHSPNGDLPMNTMRAVGLRRYLPIDNPESLLDLSLERPAPGERDLLVRVEAVSVNPVDTKVRAPKPQQEDPPRVLGYDAAGVVEAIGAGVTGFRPGDAVYYAGDVTRPGSN